MAQLTSLSVGQPVVFGGDQVTEVSAELAAAFQPGDRLVVVQTDGTLLHIPQREAALVDAAVGAAATGFAQLAQVSDEQISDFFDEFARLLEDPSALEAIAVANEADVSQAVARGRSTTRLILDEKMRLGMVAGLRGWRDASVARDQLVEQVDHTGWSVQARRAPLGVVGFVFEGRPNVFADACGVVRSGNAVVFRIGSDALGTARAIMSAALVPALSAAGLPEGVVQLVDSPAHSAGHALFSDRRLALAVARGSGAAVAQLGAVASQAGVPVSLHGTGGAWMMVGEHADGSAVAKSVEHSLDRKVCNTLNVAAVVESRAAELVPLVVEAARTAAARHNTVARFHVVSGSEQYVDPAMFDTTVSVVRAEGPVDEPEASVLDAARLGNEWEWEASPELTVLVVPDVGAAVSLFNEHSPRFVASLISTDAAEHERFYSAIDAPFVGDGFTRWVDGQYALDKPELGLSNWQSGRMLGRGGILSGDSVHTVRYRATVTDFDTHR